MKFLLPFFFFTLLLAASTQAQGVRRLLLFAADSTDASLKTQREWLRADSGRVESENVWIAVFSNPKMFKRMFDHHGADRQFFTLVLMDGQDVEVLRAEKPVPTDAIFKALATPPVPATQAGMGAGERKKGQ